VSHQPRRVRGSGAATGPGLCCAGKPRSPATAATFGRRQHSSARNIGRSRALSGVRWVAPHASCRQPGVTAACAVSDDRIDGERVIAIAALRSCINADVCHRLAPEALAGSPSGVDESTREAKPGSLGEAAPPTGAGWPAQGARIRHAPGANHVRVGRSRPRRRRAPLRCCPRDRCGACAPSR
jgi:hypothetical protein